MNRWFALVLFATMLISGLASDVAAQTVRTRRNFASAPAASGDLGAANVWPSRSVALGHRLRVTVPAGYEVGGDGIAVVDERDPRIRVAMGFELSIGWISDPTQVGFRLAVSVDVLQSKYIELFTGADFGMLWGDGFDRDDGASRRGGSFTIGAHLGVRLRSRFIRLEFAPGFAYLVRPSGFNVYLPLTLAFRVGAWLEPFMTYGVASAPTYDYYGALPREWAHHAQTGFRFVF